MTVKSGVHFGLFARAVLYLGTESHHERFLPGVIDLTLPGCYAMTELGHGSDVASLETTLTYDAATDEIVVHSPTPSSTKAYIAARPRPPGWPPSSASSSSTGSVTGCTASSCPCATRPAGCCPV